MPSPRPCRPGPALPAAGGTAPASDRAGRGCARHAPRARPAPSRPAPFAVRPGPEATVAPGRRPARRAGPGSPRGPPRRQDRSHAARSLPGGNRPQPATAGAMSSRPCPVQCPMQDPGLRGPARGMRSRARGASSGMRTSGIPATGPSDSTAPPLVHHVRRTPPPERKARCHPVVPRHGAYGSPGDQALLEDPQRPMRRPVAAPGQAGDPLHATANPARPRHVRDHAGPSGRRGAKGGLLYGKRYRPSRLAGARSGSKGARSCPMVGEHLTGSSQSRGNGCKGRRCDAIE